LSRQLSSDTCLLSLSTHFLTRKNVDPQVLEIRQTPLGWQYYVHFVAMDRRLDKWADEAELRHLSEAPVLDKPLTPGGTDVRRMTRREKRKMGEDDNAGVPMDEQNMALEKGHEERTKVKNVYSIQIGAYSVDTWYWSPYPEEYRNVPKLYMCEYCLKYMRKERTLEAHKLVCPLRHPPGNEIYRDKNISVFEVDGAAQSLYCQFLCLLAKLFIDHKTLYYDVEPFLFYVLTESDKNGYHVVGYFSKEKVSTEDLNVACILTFPQFQRKGYGNFLISLSYELSKIEKKVGTPEKPLSDLGKVSYRAYWTRVLLETLSANPNLSIDELARATAIKHEDVISTLQFLGLIRYVRGEHVVSASPKLLEQHMSHLIHPPRLTVDLKSLKWTPPQIKKAEAPVTREVSPTFRKKKGDKTN